MKVKINLTNQTLEYLDSMPYIQGTDSRNKLIVYVPNEVTNIAISYQLQNGRNTIKMSNSGVVAADSDDYLSGYWGYIFVAPKALTSLSGNFMASVIITISTNIYKINVMNTVLNSVDFEAFESALEEYESEILESLDAMNVAIGNKADRNNAEQTIVADKIKFNTWVGGINANLKGITNLETYEEGDREIILEYDNGFQIIYNNTDGFTIINTTSGVDSQIFFDNDGHIELIEGVEQNTVLLDGNGFYFNDDKILDESDVVDNLTSTYLYKPLSANQGKVLKDGLDEEITNRTNADTTLQNNINAEANTRSSNDNTLQANINAEALARSNADNTLQVNIDAAGHKIALTIDDDFKMTAVLKDKNNNTISTSNVIDLPLESVVVGGTYDEATKKVVLMLENGGTIEFSVADLVSGLQTEITAQNPLSSDLVDDTNHTHKFVSAAEKAQITTNKNNITANTNAINGIKDGTTIDSFSDVENALAEMSQVIDIDIEDFVVNYTLSASDYAKLSNRNTIIRVNDNDNVDIYRAILEVDDYGDILVQRFTNGKQEVIFRDDMIHLIQPIVSGSTSIDTAINSDGDLSVSVKDSYVENLLGLSVVDGCLCVTYEE